jgi:colanic acid/amylovoran biosynthesis glycosyltransferase
MISVLHIWDMYIPNLFDRTHPYWVENPGEVQTHLIAGSLVDTGAPLHPRTHVFTRRAVGHASNPTLWQRIHHRLLTPFREAGFRKYCHQKIEEIRPDIIHFHFGTTAAKLLPILGTVKSPFFISFYGMDASESIRNPSLQKRYRTLFQKVHRVLVLCEQVKGRIENLECPKEKIQIWNLPAGIENYPYQEREPKETVRFLTCARFVEKKGYVYLLEAFDRLLSDNRPAELTMIGYGPLKPKIEELQKKYEARGLKTPLRIIDTELRPDFIEIFGGALRTHDIFVLPSVTAKNGDDEGGPALTLVCAQAAGLPIICTPFPGAEISVEGGRSGLFVEPKNTDDLSEKLAYLMDHKELWNQLGKAGSEQVWREFSEEGQMKKLGSLYLKALEAR